MKNLSIDIHNQVMSGSSYYNHKWRNKLSLLEDNPFDPSPLPQPRCTNSLVNFNFYLQSNMIYNGKNKFKK